MKIRTYSELIRIPTFLGRFNYLKLNGKVSDRTFGSDRFKNQAFYRSIEWKRIRREVIVRDGGLDMGVDGYEIQSRVYIHHMNPITLDDITHADSKILDPEFLICLSSQTHLAIHYGDKSLLPTEPIKRIPGDTKLW